jgi:anaerobic magnesium-protoporphyrin IX monomethyl ester cyclase
MRIHLIVPASRAVLGSRIYARFQPCLLPMSLAYLGAVLRRDGHDVTLRDQPADLRSNERILDEIQRLQPELLGLSVLTESWSNVVELVQQVRSRWPEMRIVMGNTHAAFFADEVLAKGYSDFVVRGEGEETMAHLARTLAGGGDLSGVAGLSFRADGENHHNPDRPPVADLDALPRPAWDLMDRGAWRYGRFPLVGLTSAPAPVMASRGCPYSCSFCSQDKYVRGFRRRSVARVVEEVAEDVERYGFQCFGFNDAYFPWDRESGQEFCDRLRTFSWCDDVRWVTEMRVDHLDDAGVRSMAGAGLHAMILGFESGNEGVLASTNKGTTLEQGRHAARLLREHGVLAVGLFMIGLPGDTPETIRDTFRFARECKLDIAKFAVTIPYPGSPLWERLDRESMPSPEECDRFTSWFDWAASGSLPVWTPSGVTPEQLVRLQRRGMLEFYARPSYVLKVLRSGLFSAGEVAQGARIMLSRSVGRSRPTPAGPTSSRS